MTTILRIDAGATNTSHSGFQIANNIIAANPGARVMSRNLCLGPVPRVDQRWMTANFRAPMLRSQVERDMLTLSDELVAELLASDLIVISVDLNGAGLPNALRGWAEQIARAGLTLCDAPDMLAGISVILCLGTGADAGSSRGRGDALWLRHALAAIGLRDVTILASEMPPALTINPGKSVSEPAFA